MAVSQYGLVGSFAMSPLLGIFCISGQNCALGWGSLAGMSIWLLESRVHFVTRFRFFLTGKNAQNEELARLGSFETVTRFWGCGNQYDPQSVKRAWHYSEDWAARPLL